MIPSLRKSQMMLSIVRAMKFGNIKREDQSGAGYNHQMIASHPHRGNGD